LCLIGWRLISRSKEGKALESRRVVRVFVARRTWAGEQGVQRRFRVEVREDLDIGNLIPPSSAFAEVIEIPETVRVQRAVKQPF
jgi:hypothetical protein